MKGCGFHFEACSDLNIKLREEKKKGRNSEATGTEAAEAAEDGRGGRSEDWRTCVRMSAMCVILSGGLGC